MARCRSMIEPAAAYTAQHKGTRGHARHHKDDCDPAGRGAWNVRPVVLWPVVLWGAHDRTISHHDDAREVGAMTTLRRVPTIVRRYPLPSLALVGLVAGLVAQYALSAPAAARWAFLFVLLV